MLRPAPAPATAPALTQARVLCAILVCTFTACGSTPSPSETVDLLIESIQARDSVAIARYIDVGRVSESSVDPLFQAATLMERNDPERFRQQTGGMGIEALQQFRPMVAPLMETLFWQMMLHPEELESGMLAPIMGDQAFPFEDVGERYRGVAAETMEGNDAIVSLEMGDDMRSTTIDVRLEQGEDGWKVVAFENLAETIANVLGAN